MKDPTGVMARLWRMVLAFPLRSRKSRFCKLSVKMWISVAAATAGGFSRRWTAAMFKASAMAIASPQLLLNIASTNHACSTHKPSSGSLYTTE